MKQFLKTALLSSTLAVAAPALAGHSAVNSPDAYTYAVAGTGDAAAGADIRNGFSNPASNYAQGMATTQTNSLTPNGTTLSTSVTTASLQAPGRTSSASTYTSLDTGIMRSQIIQTVPTAFGSPGADTFTQFQDTVFFTNTTGQAINLALNYAFDGTASGPAAGTLSGLSYLVLGGCSLCVNATSEPIRILGTGNAANVAAYAVFDKNGVTNAYDQYSGQQLTSLGFSVLNNTQGISSIMQTTIVIPIGETSLGIRAGLILSARGAESADFGHTSQFSFGPLATGLSFTSASGVFLKGLTTTPGTGAVPEPATWAMMVFGFGFAGNVLRRRAKVRAFQVV